MNANLRYNGGRAVCLPEAGDGPITGIARRRAEPLEYRMRMGRTIPWWPLLLIACAVILWPGHAAAQTLTMTISPSTITFANSDPDTTPTITAPNITVTYRVQSNGSNNWRITLLAGGDLTAGSDIIPITNVTWTATPVPPFQSGTLSKTVAQTLASGTGSVTTSKTGTVSFKLANSWSYNVGSHTASVVFTISAP